MYWLKKKYPLVNASVWAPIVASISLLVATSLGFAFGESEITGWIIYWSSAGVLFSMLLGSGLVVLFARRRILSAVIGVSALDKIVFRADASLSDDEKTYAINVFKEWTIHDMSGDLISVLSSSLKQPDGGWFGDIVWVTFKREGEVSISINGKKTLAHGFCSGSWIEVELISAADGMSKTLGLLEHELMHVPICKIYPGMSGDEQHVLMAKMSSGDSE